jgi:hypothetical protein
MVTVTTIFHDPAKGLYLKSDCLMIMRDPPSNQRTLVCQSNRYIADKLLSHKHFGCSMITPHDCSSSLSTGQSLWNLKKQQTSMSNDENVSISLSWPFTERLAFLHKFLLNVISRTIWNWKVCFWSITILFWMRVRHWPFLYLQQHIIACSHFLHQVEVVLAPFLMISLQAFAIVANTYLWA